MKFRLSSLCALFLVLFAANAQGPVMNPPVNIFVTGVGTNSLYAKSFISCSVSATTSIADPTIVSITPTSGAFASGTALFTLTGLAVGSTVVTINYTLSGCAATNKQSVDTLNVTVGGPPPGSGPITKLANNYSYTLAGLPNYGIAQGSIFDIFGTNLASTSTPVQSVPLSTSLAGVTVTVTVNGTTTNVILLAVTPTQIAAILPSATPVGTGTLSVFNNGKLVGSIAIQVVQSAFGMITLNGAGTGQAVGFDVNNKLVTFTNALNPGDYVVLWGTGVGPVPAGTDETVAQTAANLTNVPFSAWIGGVPATVYYRGRSQYPGLDQVILIVPEGVTPGCYVSVVGQSGNIVTNFASLPVATTGRTCSEPTLGFSTDQYQAIANKGTFAGGMIGIDKTALTFSGVPVSSDVAAAQFFSVTSAQFNALPMPFASLGSCTVFTGTDLIGLVGNASLYGLNAGSALSVTGPLGSGMVPRVNNSYKAQQNPLGGVSPSGLKMLPPFIPSAGGTFTFNNGTGGPDVGAFSASVALSPGAFTWTNQSSLTTINRANPLTVTWTGAAKNTFVLVSGVSVSQQAPYSGAEFFCSVPAAAGTFTVPPAVLLSLPAGGNGRLPANALQVSQVLFGLPFSAPQLDAGVISSGFTYMNLVTYQ